MKLTRYENEVCDVGGIIPDEDEYTFSVLKKIVKGNCALLLTDHRRVIICHSCRPYPVWVWLAKDAGQQEREAVYQELKKEFPFEEGYTFNMGYPLAEYVIKRGQEEGSHIGITMNMMAYCCPRVLPLEQRAAGSVCPARDCELETAVRLCSRFHEDIGIDKRSEEEYRRQMEGLIRRESLFFWRTPEGSIVAMCSYSVRGDKGSIGHVYTLPEARRKGYAYVLVYYVTERIIRSAKMPVLYTNADYEASNGCYRKIGFLLQGTLCTIGATL